MNRMQNWYFWLRPWCFLRPQGHTFFCSSSEHKALDEDRYWSVVVSTIN
ncbi:unnamed protein product [Amoebophrya sp. A25]|nr:unnamed protein product [Amoebophrya sp. A25]|eukprot:GSA25T00022742001.1